jgi:hypothetical protein
VVQLSAIVVCGVTFAEGVLGGHPAPWRAGVGHMSAPWRAGVCHMSARLRLQGL